MDRKPDKPPAETAATCRWESEGGSVRSAKTQLPEGIVAVSVTHYRVGPYSYTNLDDAMAEHRRQSSGHIAIQQAAVGEL